MLIFSIESSAKPASVAVFEDNTLLGSDFQNSGFSHSRTLLYMAQTLFAELGINPSDINLAAVANGPGSFTGVRIGVSVVKGFAFGLDIPVCGVSALEAMAEQTEGDGLICPVMDARRGQLYNALFKREYGKLVRLRDDRAISITDLVTDLESFNEPFIPVGDGLDLFISSITNEKELNYILPPEDKKYQSAIGVALASFNSKPVPAVMLEPVYLRPSQAERVRLQAQS